MNINIFKENNNEKSSSIIGLTNLHKNMMTHNSELIKDDIYDEEINSLPYKSAIKTDKRTYIEYYVSLLKMKQKIIYTFFTSKDGNLRSIKICCFLFSFALDFTINTLFYNDSTMHQIYVDEGEYEIIYQITNILYTTIISNIIGNILDYFSENKINIINKNKDNIIKNNKTKRCIVIKLTFFFILDFLFLSVFWYYVSVFCVVYRNTQIHLIKDTLVSFILSLLYPFGVYLLPGIFRIPSLRATEQNRNCLYLFSRFVENVIFFFV